MTEIKIIHIISNKTFTTYFRTISDLIPALKTKGIQQTIISDEANDKLNFTGILKYILPFSKGFFGFNFKLNKILKQHKPQIIITWGEKARNFISNIHTPILHLSFVESISNLKSFNNCDYLFTNSEAILSFLKNNGWSGSKSFFIPPFVRQLKPSVITKKDLFIPERSKIIFSATGFYKANNFQPLFYALSTIPELYMILVGYGGSDKKEIENLAADIGIKPRIRFTNLSDKLSGYLNISEFSIFPFFDIEMQKSILDSFQMRKMVICNKNYLTNDLIQDKYNGLILHSDIYTDIADIISTNLEDKSNREEITNNAFNSYYKRYTEEICINTYIDMLKTIINLTNNGSEII